MLDRAKNIRMIKEAARLPKAPKQYSIPKVSKKRQKELKEIEQMTVDGKTPMDLWFEERRKEMVGTCQCGCGEKTSKNDDMYYRHCICHILPKSKFPSVDKHPLNCIEMAFWGGCHTNMDERSSHLWPNMACWDEILMRFKVLYPLTKIEERKHLPDVFKKWLEDNPGMI